jgi:hypothetical protein
MDLLVHSAAGTFSVERCYNGEVSAARIIAGALLPDADMFLEPFLDPQSGCPLVYSRC